MYSRTSGTELSLNTQQNFLGHPVRSSMYQVVRGDDDGSHYIQIELTETRK